MENLSSTELLLKAVGDLAQRNPANIMGDLDGLDDLLTELAIMFPHFSRDEIDPDIWEALINDLFKTMKHSLLNRN